MTILNEIDRHDTGLERLKVSCCTFFKLCKKDDMRTILLIEGLTTIPYQDRLALISDNLMATLKQLVSECYAEGHFKNFDPQMMIIFLYGLISETGRSFEHTKDHDEYLSKTSKSMDSLLDKLAHN